MASEFIAGLGIFKSLLDSVKGLKDINDAAVINPVIIELSEKVLTAREQQSAALERISQLEKELARFENWETEKQRYELADVGDGAVAYRLKPSMANGEPPHSICAYCYQQAIKSPLQPEARSVGRTEHLVCHECGSDLIISGIRQNSPPPKVITKRPRNRF